ncbi:MAG: ATP-binding cassette domain-containing protein [Pseudomonadota bacterium]
MDHTSRSGGPSSAPLLSVQDIHLAIGGVPLLAGAELFLFEGDRLCVVGRNGSGKSTLLKIIAGLVEPDDGKRFVQPGTTVRYLEQEPDFAGHKTVRDYVEAGLAPGDDPVRAQILFADLDLDPEADPATLSGGEARRAALIRVLAPQPDLLLLDEPTNHLDLTVIDWLERTLAQTKSGLVLISHDRRFLETLTRRTAWIDRASVRTVDRGFAHFEAWRDEVLEQEELERHKLDRKIAAEEDWLRYGVTARRKRNVRRLADLHALREKRATAVKAVGRVKATASEATLSGKKVIEAKGLSKAYDGPAVVSDFSIDIARGDRIGLAGPNGAGKTTLLNLLTGQLAPDTGTLRLGTNLEIVSLDQRRASLKDDDTLAEALTEGRGDMLSVGGEQRHVIGYMKDFLFTPDQARSPVSALSGGERGRLALAIALARPSNLLVLDEPTNDLDLETLDLLHETLAAYDGTVLLVSHDRDFLDRSVTSLIAPNPTGPPGAWTQYAGGYSDMRAQQAERSAGRSDEPGPRRSSGGERKTVKPAAKTPSKLSYKEKYALETLPGRISEAEATIENVKKILADPQLFTRDPSAFTEEAGRLEALESALAAMEEEWLRLEMKREELEG